MTDTDSDNSPTETAKKCWGCNADSTAFTAPEPRGCVIGRRKIVASQLVPAEFKSWTDTSTQMYRVQIAYRALKPDETLELCRMVLPDVTPENTNIESARPDQSGKALSKNQRRKAKRKATREAQ